MSSNAKMGGVTVLVILAIIGSVLMLRKPHIVEPSAAQNPGQTEPKEHSRSEQKPAAASNEHPSANSSDKASKAVKIAEEVSKQTVDSAKKNAPTVWLHVQSFFHWFMDLNKRTEIFIIIAALIVGFAVIEGGKKV